MVYQCHYIEAVDAKSIQTNLKVEHVWNLIRYTGTRNVSPPKNVTTTPQLL